MGTRARVRPWLRRFAMGLLVAAATTSVVIAADVILWDLPTPLDPVPSRFIRPDFLQPLPGALLLLGAVALGLVAGWCWRGPGTLGAAIGGVGGGLAALAAGDGLAAAINPYAYSLGDALYGWVEDALASFVLLALPTLVAVFGLVGWAIRSARERRRMRGHVAGATALES